MQKRQTKKKLPKIQIDREKTAQNTNGQRENYLKYKWTRRKLLKKYRQTKRKLPIATTQ